MSEHRTFPKPAPILLARIDRDRAFDQAWEACKRAVDVRDHYRCRVCGRKVVKTMTLCAERAEHHHLTPRSIAPSLMLEVKNILLTCSECHGKLTRHELTPTGTEYFHTTAGTFLDAEGDIQFR